MQDLDLKAQLLTVAGKGRKTRRVPFSSSAATALDRYLAVRDQNPWAVRSDAVFLGRSGPLTRSGLQELLERIGERLEIKDLHPHKLRHTAADSMLSLCM